MAGVKVRLHQLVGPFRLTNIAPSFESPDNRLDVEDWSSIDGIEPRDMDAPALDAQDLTSRNPDPIRPTRTPLSKDADLGPVWVVARVAARENLRTWLNSIKEKYDFTMRELIQAEERFLRNVIREFYRDGFIVPVVVMKFGSG